MGLTVRGSKGCASGAEGQKMEIALPVLLMLLAVALSDVIVRLLPFRLPLPLVQIMLGVGLAWSGKVQALPLSPELFYLVFLAPLLFADGIRMPRREFLQLRAAIFGLAVGLVVATVAGVGYFLHWLIPKMPLATGFAVGAVLAPTDAVAVTGLAGNLGIPRRLMHLLRGEALLNDATGLVCLRLAVAAALTGHFSPREGMLEFLQLCSIGLAVGCCCGMLSGALGVWLSRRHYEEPSGQALLSLALPFLAFLSAEHLGGSGILSSVAAGLSFSASCAPARRDSFLRLHIHEVWRVLEFSLNGLIFVLLGRELPERLGVVPEVLLQTPVAFLAYPLMVLILLLSIRYLWVRLWLRWCWQTPAVLSLPNHQLVLTISMAGVRGTVSLASVISLPLADPSGVNFPYREAAIYLAASVTLMTLVGAAIGLPLLIRHLDLPPLDQFALEELEARRSMLQQARESLLEGVQQAIDEGDNPEMAHFLGGQLDQLLEMRLSELVEWESPSAQEHSARNLEKRLRSRALAAQDQVLQKLRCEQRINDVTMTHLQSELDLQRVASLQHLGQE